MKKLTIITSLLTVALLFVTGCTTVTGPNGQPQSVMNPMGAAVVQTLASTALGAGTGALMRGVNPVAIGAVSSGVGSIGSQVINSFIPQGGQQQPQQQSYNPTPVTYGVNQRQSVASSGGSASLYQRQYDGSFVPASVSYQQMSDGSYAPVSSSGKPLYRLLANGSFAPAN
jgi:hypothetical protein